MKGDPEKGGKIENRDRLYFHARFGLSILRKSEKRREKWDRHEEICQSLFSLKIYHHRVNIFVY